jgi:putative addiction module component (TIGR02574 family)
MRIRGLEKKVLELPPRSRLRIARKIIESIDGLTRKEIEAVWSQKIERRVKEIESDKIKGTSASQVIAEARRVLNEVRKMASTGRK